MAVFPGQDFSSFIREDGLADLDLNFRIIVGPRVVLETVARRWISTVGSMDDPSFGAEALRYLNASLTSQEVGVFASALRSEALKVEGVDSIAIESSLGADGTLTGKAVVTLEDGESYDLAFAIAADKIMRIYGLGEV